MVKRALAALLGFSLLVGARPAHADPVDDNPYPAVPAPPAPPKAMLEPALHHVPVSTAREHEPLAVTATIDRPDLQRRAVLVYRHGDEIAEVVFSRSTSDAAPYIAVIPAEHVARPQIAYAIELERADGVRVPVFASRAEMEPVEVVGDFMDAREETLLARLSGRRFVTSMSGQYARFGPGDDFYQVEGAFTYRLLRTVSEFGVRAGVYRGTSVVPGATGASNVGLNYGAPWLRLRAADWLHFDGELLTSVTEVGFSLGGGAAVIIGDPYAADLTLGFESIQVFGTRGYSRFEAHALPWFLVAPMIEVTSMPGASTAGVRLLLDLGFELGKGFSLTVRGGYQARSFASGGPAAGGTITYAF